MSPVPLKDQTAIVGLGHTEYAKKVDRPLKRLNEEATVKKKTAWNLSI